MSEEPTLYPDTPIEDVTLERIGEIFDSEKLEYRVEEQTVGEGETVKILRTGFSNIAIALQVRDDVLVAEVEQVVDLRIQAQRRQRHAPIQRVKFGLRTPVSSSLGVTRTSTAARLPAGKRRMEKDSERE